MMKDTCENCRFWLPIDGRNFIGVCNSPQSKRSSATDKLETCELHEPAPSEIEEYLS